MRIDEIEKGTVPSYEILDFVEKIHGIPEDFVDGDIEDRILQYDFYELREISLSDLDLDEFNVDHDYVKELVDDITSNNSYEPIVYDPKKQSIVDGIHRANALDRLGYKTIKAYVGKDSNETR